MQAITKTGSPTGNMPAPMDLVIEREFRVLAMKLDPSMAPTETRYSLTAADAPSPQVRRALEIRRASVLQWLAPAGGGPALEQYDKLKEIMAHRESTTPEGAEIRTRAYVADWAGVPLFALALTCRDFRRGVIGDGKWLPEPGLVRAEAMRRCADLAKERRELDAVLDAVIRPPVIDRTRKAELLAAAASFVSGHRMAAAGASRGGMTPEEIADAKALSVAIATGTRDPRPMPKMSPYLRASLGVPPSPPASHDAPSSDMVPDGIGTENAA